MAYKKNHTIPRTILKHWISSVDGREGVFVYEIEKDREYFSSAAGGKAFSFAISNYLYVPEIDSLRYPNLEKWKGNLEGTLSVFIEILKKQQRTDIAKNNDHLAQILMSILSLHATSKYDIESANKFLLKNPEYKKLISGRPARESEILVLENIINFIAEEVNSYNAIEFTVITSDQNNEFIYCDRPLIAKPFDGTSFIVLTKNILLAFSKSDDISTINYIDCKPDFANTINEVMAESSREWIIASNELVLNKYKAIIGSERWLESKSNDNIKYQPIRFLQSGHYFNSEL